MPVTTEAAGPYAPPSAVLGIIERHRTRGLPPIVDAAALERCGIAPGLIPRTLQALNRLDLIDVQGRPTSVFEGLRLAPQSEYQPRLRDWLDAAYADAVAYVDPATATESQIRDAFRRYKPIGQQPRMVTLFVGLYTAAGLSVLRARALRKEGAAVRALTAHAPVARSTRPHHARPALSGELPAPLGALLTRLPSEGQSWTRQQRDRFMAAFAAVLDLCVPIAAEREEPERLGGEDDP